MQQDGLLPKPTSLRCSKYPNNLIDQDHRDIKSRTRPMLGFKNYASALTIIARIELLRQDGRLSFVRDEGGLTIKLPEQIPNDYAYAFRIG
jgi:hypothetical protein